VSGALPSPKPTRTRPKRLSWAVLLRPSPVQTTGATSTLRENPPKNYQDIYPLNFDTDPTGLYAEIRRVVQVWTDHGVKIFGVDNPHTKPLTATDVGDSGHRPVPQRVSAVTCHPVPPAGPVGSASSGVTVLLRVTALARVQRVGYGMASGRSPEGALGADHQLGHGVGQVDRRVRWASARLASPRTVMAVQNTFATAGGA